MKNSRNLKEKQLLGFDPSVVHFCRGHPKVVLVVAQKQTLYNECTSGHQVTLPEAAISKMLLQREKDEAGMQLAFRKRFGTEYIEAK